MQSCLRNLPCCFHAKEKRVTSFWQKEASQSSFVPKYSYWWRLIMKCPRTMMILWSLMGALCCPASTSESKIHVTHPESQAGQDHCALQPHCSLKKQSTVKFIYCNGFGHSWTVAGMLNGTVLLFWMWECSSDCEETGRDVFIAL